MSNTKYVDATVVAKYFGVSRASIFNRVAAGAIPPGAYLRIGRVFRFDLDAVEKALKEASAHLPLETQLELDLEVPDDPEDTENPDDMENDYGN